MIDHVLRCAHTGPQNESEISALQAVADAQSIGEGELLGVEVDGRPVVLGRVDGVVYAISGLCPHQRAPLAEGDLDGPILTCPLHNGAVDITTAQPACLPISSPAQRYAVSVENGMVLVARDPTAAPGGPA